jgi:hypothetical protein
MGAEKIREMMMRREGCEEERDARWGWEMREVLTCARAVEVAEGSDEELVSHAPREGAWELACCVLLLFLRFCTNLLEKRREGGTREKKR